MAGTVTTTVTQINYSQTGTPKFCKKVSVAWTADAADGSVPSTSLELNGWLVKAVTNPGAVAPTDGYDIALLDPDDGALVAAIKAQVKVQDITYTALAAGADGNSITITYPDGASSGAANVTVNGNDIEVEIEDGVTTAQAIANAIEESLAASVLVTVAVDPGDETDPQTAVDSPAYELSGGADETGSGSPLDVMAGALADRSTSNGEQVLAFVGSSPSLPVLLAGTYGLEITNNSVNSATGLVVFYLVDSI
jgi:hypothetical protein